MIGVPILPSDVDEMLRRFGLQPASSTKDQSSWRIPSHRYDLQRDVDLIEEVVSVFGIANVPPRYRSRFTTESDADRNHDFETGVRTRLVGRGLNEARTSKLISKAAATREGAIDLK